ncbi:MAG TPA: hypothetical protein VD731_05415 [Nitrosopumilaceae archaeon]|nr:hypothetical protein [Nitrosopumilaceae archaeon]
MTKSKKMTFTIIPISMIALATILTVIPITYDAYAENPGHSGVGLRPSLGIDNRGHTLIEDGLTINGQTFMAEYFAQTIKTQTVNVDQPIDITLHYFIKGGPKYIEHTTLSIVNGKESKNIDWNQDFKGTQTVTVSDNKFFKNVMVNLDADSNNPDAVFLNFKFRISENIDKSSLKIVTWNSAKEAWTNYFYEALSVVGANQTSDTNKIKSPLKQTKSGIAASNVECDVGKSLMFKTNGTPICVTPSTAAKLVAMGWVKQA